MCPVSGIRVCYAFISGSVPDVCLLLGPAGLNWDFLQLCEFVLQSMSINLVVSL